MNLVIFWWIVKKIFKPRDNILGSFGMMATGIFIIVYFFTLQIQFIFFIIASAIIAFMGGLEIKFDEKTERQLELFEQSFKR